LGRAYGYYLKHDSKFPDATHRNEKLRSSFVVSGKKLYVTGFF